MQKSALNPIIHVVFPYALQNDVLFESILAFALYINPQRKTDPTVTTVMQHHRASALKKLNRALSSAQASDAVVLSVAMFLTVDVSLVTRVPRPPLIGPGDDG